MHFSECLASNAADRSRSLALADQACRMDWKTLAANAADVAAHMQANGCVPGAHVAICGKTSIAYIVAIHAVALAGGVLVPLNTRLSPAEIASQLDDCEPVLILVDRLGEAMSANWSKRWRSRRLSLTKAAETHHLGVSPKAANQNAQTITTLLYTGGTTGRSKGVLLSSCAMLANAQAVASALGITAQDRCLIAGPMFHISGAGAIWFCALTGACAVPLASFDTKVLCQQLRSHQISVLFLAPTMLRMLFDDPEFDPDAFATVRELMYGSSPISESLLVELTKRLPHVRITQAYGQTEICPLTFLSHEDHMRALNGHANLLRSAGRAIEGIEIRIGDHDDGPGLRNVPGEVFARGDAMMSGYHNMPNETASTIVDGFVRTGDIGMIDDQGYLTLVDRAKDMIITGGENVYSTEVEKVLGDHPDVIQAAVIAVPDDRWGERVHAVVQTRRPVCDSGLVDFCRTRLAAYKCPKTLDQIDAMPLTPAGKIDKKRLRLPFWQNREKEIG